MNSNRITFFGDFKADDVSSLVISKGLADHLHGSAVNVVNFEAPVVSSGHPIRKSGPCISQSPDAPSWLERAGFNAVSLANNHSMDFGKDGLEATRKAFSEAVTMGAGEFSEAYSFHRFDLDGNSVGIICASQGEFGTLYGSDGYGCAWVSHREIDRMILGNKDSVDVLLLYLHCGVEYLDVPIPEWRESYRRFIDLGADAVIASHPHVPQGWEMYNGKMIVYSLGNFCFQLSGSMKVREHWFDGLGCDVIVKGPHQADFSIFPLHYDDSDRSIDIDGSDSCASHLAEIGRMLHDETVYMDTVNRAALDLLPTYMGLFSRSGLVSWPPSKWYLKGVVERLSMRRRDMTHALNNVRCESHRWMIQRALSLKYDI